MQINTAGLTCYRAQLAGLLQHLDQALPGQEGPALDFGHYNTFGEALAASEQQYRQLYQQGRINDSDLAAALAHYAGVHAAAMANQAPAAIYKTAMLYDLQAINSSQLDWHCQTLNALTQLQPDVPETVRAEFWAGGNEATAVRQLWQSLLDKLEIQHAGPHPEALLKFTAAANPAAEVHQQTRQQAETELAQMLADLGDGISLRGLVLALSGIDSLDFVRPQLQRICASALDEGIAAWQLPEHQTLGLYAAWRAAIPFDANLFLHQLPDWQDIIAELPAHPLDNISLQLLRLAIPQANWGGYLRLLALELPGWTGFINGRQQHPNHPPRPNAAPAIADYLAIRLTLDRLWLNQICHDLWKVEAKFSALQTYFQKNLSEFLIRKRLYAGELPEYLTELAESLIIRAGSERQCRSDWQQLADLLHTWQLSQTAARHSAGDSGWRLFRLCQHVGLNAERIRLWCKADLEALLAVLDTFTVTERSKLWLYAYEQHYREAIFRS